MEGFTSSFHSLKPSFSLPDIEQNMELLNQYSAHSHYYENQNMTSQSFINDNFFPQQVIDHQFMQCFQPDFQHEQKNVMVIPGHEVFSGPVLSNGKRKSVDVSSSSNENSSSQLAPAQSEINENKKQSSRKGKKVKASDSVDPPKEVVHVRARRGQATDSHSIAERVRRGKINERLRCLQDIVPGCYKSMGMAVMLDEIINYVQSLQNQVEFLSMKLTEASNFPNFDLDLAAIDAFQMENVIEGMKMQRLEEREEIGPVDLSFGSYPSLPYHTT